MLDGEGDGDGLLPAPASWFEANRISDSSASETGRTLISCVTGLAPEHLVQEGEPCDKRNSTTEHVNVVVGPSHHHDSTLFSTKSTNSSDSPLTRPMHSFKACENNFPCTNKQTTEETAELLEAHCRIPSQEGHLGESFVVDENDPYHHQQQQQQVGSPSPSPSWKEVTSQVLPAAAREILSTSLQRFCHTARLSYAITTEWRDEYRELGNPTRGYFRNYSSSSDDLPPFSSLPWVERQMVQEWRTYNNGITINNTQVPSPNEQQLPTIHTDEKNNENRSNSMTDSLSSSDSWGDERILHDRLHDSGQTNDDEEDEDEFVRARTLVPKPMGRPTWQHADTCFACYKPFGPTRLRHHCRLCGHSFCQLHSSHSYPLPHLGYKVPERVCDDCHVRLTEHDLAERVAWRLARCRDLTEESLCPYFGIGVDTMHDMAIRLTKAALAMAKSIPLGAQASVAVETIEVLRRYGLNGIYTILLRKEFLAAADMLRKALGIDRRSWPLSVHELSAAIFYALAQHRALRGLYPDREHEIHALQSSSDKCLGDKPNPLLSTEDEEGSRCGTHSALPGMSGIETKHQKVNERPRHQHDETCAQNKIVPVCEPLSDSSLNSLIFYAPLALSFVYVEKEVDMQLLAAQQGWKLLYAFLQQQESYQGANGVLNRPASAVFVHEKHRIACLAIRGTATIHDVVTDIRQVPVPFPEPDVYKVSTEDWTTMSNSQGVAVSGMVGAAMNLFREHVDSLLYLAQEGYRIRLVGHSLGGAVATLIGVLLRHDFPALEQAAVSSNNSDRDDSLALRVYSYGTPSIVDAQLSDLVQEFAISVVLHDDAVPRLSPASCRGLLKHLLHIRETWVKEHLPDDIMAITERAKLVWAPRWREGFTLLSTPSSTSIRRYCRNQYRNGKNQFLTMKDRLMKAADDQFGLSTKQREHEDISVRAGEAITKPVAASQADEFTFSEEAGDNGTASETRLFVDYMGGIDHKTSGIVIDGDEFFETNGESLVEDENDEECFTDAEDELVYQQEKERSAVIQKESTVPDADPAAVIEDSSSSDDDSPEVVVLAETPLPRLYVPGKIVHIYSHRGVYRAVYVPRSFRELRQISMAGNLLTDHKCKSYYEALLEVRTVRAAPEDPPRWTSFDEDDTCACCASRFTWASTSNSKAQQARDKHNCRSCGALVCDPCSSNRVPLPSLGLSCPVRVCDRCYHDIDGIMTKCKDANGATLPVERHGASGYVGKPERVRERRSEVVDELVSRITAPGLL